MGKTFQDLLNNGLAQVLGIVSPVPMGNWLATTQYQKLNLVRHNTATYIARTSNRNIEPGVADDWATYWMLICIDGGQVSPDGEYPEMSVGSVMHALLWGNKSYDGSSTQTITAADLGLADVYKPQGSIAFASLPATPNESNYGYVWNITNDFTTDSRFIEGAGKEYSAGTNVGVIEQDGQYYYDILGNFVDLSDYAKIDGNYQEMTVGTATNAQNAANVTAQINGHSISDIFETDGTTVKEATQAQRASADEDGNNIPNTYARQNGSYPNLGAGTAEIANRTGSIVIQNNADLNDCTANLNEVQVYTCQTNATAATLSNCPVDVTFTMWTTRAFEESSNSSRDFQFLIAINSQCYYRVRSGGTTWANWRTLVESNGTYNGMTVGAVLATQLTNQDIHDFQGPEYWGKTYFGAGRNTVQNKPEGVDGFYLEVLRGGTSSTIHKLIATADTSGESVSPNVYIEQYVTNWSTWEEEVTSDGKYKTLGAGRIVAAGRLEAGSDVNNCIPEEYEALYVWSCWSTAAVPGILNLPAGLTGTFYLTAYKTWAGDTDSKYRLIQTIYECAGNRGIYQRSEDNSGGDGNITSPWQQLVYSDGSYPTLGAGYLANRVNIKTRTSSLGWYQFATVSQINDSADISVILLVNGIYGNQNQSDNLRAGTGILEIDVRYDNGTISSATIGCIAGNIDTSMFCSKIDGNAANFYCNINLAYKEYNFTLFDVKKTQEAYLFNNTYFSFTNIYTNSTSAPEDAVYAVNRNVAAKGITPATSSNSDDVATTEWVRDYFNVSNNRSDLDAVFSATFTGTSGIRSLGDSYYNHPFFAIKWTKTNSSSEAYTNTLFIPTDMITQGNTFTYFSLTDTEDYLNWWFNSSSSFQFESSKNTQLTIYFYDFNF